MTFSMTEYGCRISYGEVVFELKTDGAAGRVEETTSGLVSQSENPGREWLRLVTKPDDRIILPVTEGCAFRADDTQLVPMYHNIPYNRRINTMGVILFERDNCYLALAPERTFHAETDLYINEEGICEATVVWQQKPAKLHIFVGGLAEVVRAYRKLRKEQGILVTLAEKEKKLPQLKRLQHSAIIWPWQNDYEKLMYANRDEAVELASGRVHLRIAHELKAAGMDDKVDHLLFVNYTAENNQQTNHNAARKYGSEEFRYVCSFECPETVKVGEAVQFVSHAEEAAHCLWDFGQGIPSTEEQPTFTYTKPGVYTVTLIAWNAQGDGARYARTIEVTE